MRAADASGRSSLILAIAGFMPGAALALLPIGWPDPVAVIGWLLAPPLWTAALAYAAGFPRASSLAKLFWRQIVPCLLLSLPVTVVVAGFVGWAGGRLLETGALSWVLAFSALLTGGWLTLWQIWPAPLAPFLESTLLMPSCAPWMIAGRSLRWARQWREQDHDKPAFLGTSLWLLALAAPATLFMLEPQLDPAVRGRLWMGAALSGLLAQIAQVKLAIPAGQSVQNASPAPITPAAIASPVFMECELTEADDNPAKPLYAAVRAGQVDQALALIEAGVDIHALPARHARDQRTLSMLAALLADLRLLRTLIARGADLNRRHSGLTPLLVATRDSYHGRADAVLTLLANGADPQLADSDGNTPLHFAARSRDPGIAAQLIDAGAIINALNRHGSSPLFEACSSANWDLARFLLGRGARCNPEGGQPALLAAASTDEDDSIGVRLLLKHRAQADVRGRLGRTPLLAACLDGHIEIASALLDAGADVNTVDESGVTPLMEAARAGANAVIGLLARFKPDPKATDKAGRTALAIACQSQQSNAETVSRLLELGVPAGLPSQDRRRPIDHAVANGRWALVMTLDPAFPLPASVADAKTIEEILIAPAQLLMQALRNEQWDKAETALALAGGMAGAERAAVLLDLVAADPSAAAQRWLAMRLADPVSGSDTGCPAMVHLFDKGAAAAPALLALLERGVSPAGQGGLARYLHACLRLEQTSRQCESLALALLTQGADPFGSEAGNEVPLLLALRLGWLHLLEKLLALGVDPNIRDANGVTALHLACAMGLEPAVRLLIFHGASIHSRSADGQTPQGRVLASGRRDLARWLSWSQWQPPPRRFMDSDLAAAAVSGDETAAQLLIEMGLPVDGRDAQGCSALLHAAGQGHSRLVRVLLACGADPNLAADSGATCLSAAVSRNHIDIAIALLDHGAAIDARLAGGATVTMVAAALGWPDMLKLLLARGADPAVRDEQGNTALLAAARFAFSASDPTRAGALFDLLLDTGQDVNACSAAGYSPLLLLLGAGMEPDLRCNETLVLGVLERLLARNVDLNAQDPRGFGPLHLAALRGLGQVVHRLLRAGAAPALRDNINRTAREIALLRGFVDIAAEFEFPAVAVSIARFLRTP